MSLNKHPAMHGAVPKRNVLSQNFNSAKVELLCCVPVALEGFSFTLEPCRTYSACG